MIYKTTIRQHAEAYRRSHTAQTAAIKRIQADLREESNNLSRRLCSYARDNFVSQPAVASRIGISRTKLNNRLHAGQTLTPDQVTEIINAIEK